MELPNMLMKQKKQTEEVIPVCDTLFVKEEIVCKIFATGKKDKSKRKTKIGKYKPVVTKNRQYN